jgi:Ran GTPase-activating protein (RanGAP) involved in mRNA processing and transport
MPGNLATGLRACTALTDLRLSHNQLEMAPMQHLARALRHTPQLTHLDLSYNNLDAKTVGKLVREHGKLRTLILKKCGIKEEGATAMGRDLRTCTFLEHLDMEDNHIRPEGARVLLRTGPRHLNYLNIAGNILGPDGLKLLAESLEGHTIRHLDASDNFMGNGGVSYLLRGDYINQIEHLSLDRSGLSSVGMVEISQLLAQSTALRQLDLYNNSENHWPRNAAKLPEGCVITGIGPYILN